ncbi:GntR family transcriptional regulator [uncultured Victivallis sp.]|uniref:GntR family transcriptional regulator n=1 Tax=uncultured Victivallis sp. TaxID=354118 RepID=UPI0025958782|nr:GntR family transcriptional regulator [uncultured Victivallis sp.]
MAGMRTNLAKQALVRYIREGGLQAGDRLPAQGELRQKLGFGVTTISTALHELQRDNVLKIRDKIGIFVVDPETNGHIGRRIGLAVNALEVSAFRSCLTNLLQIKLAQQGWQVVPFFSIKSDLSSKQDVSSFVGLQRAVEQSEIDALISLCDLSKKSLRFFTSYKQPILFIGCLKPECSRITIDMAAFLRKAAEKLVQMGIRRSAVLIPEAIKEDLAPVYTEILHSSGTNLLLTGNFIQDGAAAARQLLKLSPVDRPNGVIIADDTLASSFTAELFRQRSFGYLPRMAILRNTQNPMDFATDDPICFYVDQNALVEKTVTLLRNLLQGGKKQVSLYTPFFAYN